MVNADAESENVRDCVTRSADETRELARRLGAACRGGEVLLLYGDLGAGKTCFVQGLAVGLGVPPSLSVTSPTFTLHIEYPGRLVLNHLDLYRLDDPVSVDALGIDDMLADRRAVTAIEWPEMLADGRRGHRLEIRIGHGGELERQFTLSGFGPEYKRLLDVV